ncbi:MAG: hypothetical protein ACI8UO_005446 [Verrucomicrobiales bacterium]
MTGNAAFLRQEGEKIDFHQPQQPISSLPGRWIVISKIFSLLLFKEEKVVGVGGLVGD